jgi:hypothetical protein
MPDQNRSISTHAACPIDPTGLTGTWVNTECLPRGVTRVVIDHRPNGLAIWALGADDHTHEGWGWTGAEALYAATSSGHDAVAFTTAYMVESMPVALHANLSKGLLIVASFQTSFDSGNSDARFAREFFRRSNSEMPKLAKVPAKQYSARPDTMLSSVSTFVGTWRNTNSEGCAIASVAFAATDDGLTMRIVGRDGSALCDWGTTTVEIYTEVGAASEPAKIKARCDLGLIDVLLHGWVKQGVLVLALFRCFKDGSGSSNYFDREFFYRTDEPAKSLG